LGHFNKGDSSISGFFYAFCRTQSCTGRASTGGLRVPAFAGGGAGTHGAMRAGAGRARDMNFFVRVSEC